MGNNNNNNNMGLKCSKHVRTDSVKTTKRSSSSLKDSSTVDGIQRVVSDSSATTTTTATTKNVVSTDVNDETKQSTLDQSGQIAQTHQVQIVVDKSPNPSYPTVSPTDEDANQGKADAENAAPAGT